MVSISAALLWWRSGRGFTCGAISVAFAVSCVVASFGAPSSLAEQPTLRATFGNGHTARVAGIAYSPDGRLLASGSEDGTVKLWDTATGLCIATLDGHCRGVWCIAFSPDGKLVASGNDDGTVRLWNAATAKCVTTLGETKPFREAAPVISLAISRDGGTIASGDFGGGLKLWNLRAGNTATVLIEPEKMRIPNGPPPNEVYSLAFTPDGKVLVSAGTDGKIKLWDAATGKESGAFNREHGGAGHFALSLDGKLLASGNRDASITIWDFGSRTAKATIDRHRRSGSNSLSFSPDGKSLASVGSRNYVELWSVNSGWLITQNSIVNMATSRLGVRRSAPTVRRWRSVPMTAGCTCGTSRAERRSQCSAGTPLASIQSISALMESPCGPPGETASCSGTLPPGGTRRHSTTLTTVLSVPAAKRWRSLQRPRPAASPSGISRNAR